MAHLEHNMCFQTKNMAETTLSLGNKTCGGSKLWIDIFFSGFLCFDPCPGREDKGFSPNPY